jgi:hypothetical protein
MTDTFEIQNDRFVSDAGKFHFRFGGRSGISGKFFILKTGCGSLNSPFTAAGGKIRVHPGKTFFKRFFIKY